MSDHPPTPSHGFESTRWTVVLEAARQGTEDASRAFGRLYESYWHPVYGFIRRRGHSPEQTEDLCQEFFIDLLARNAFEGLRPELGRFRCFLGAALRNFLANAWDRGRSLKRGGGIVHIELDRDEAERRYRRDTGDSTPELLFDRQWAWTLIDRTLTRLKAEYVQAGRSDLFETLRGFLAGAVEGRTHAEVAEQHGVTPNAVGVAIHRLRRRYGELLREEVSRTVQDPDETIAELRHLIAIVENDPTGPPVPDNGDRPNPGRSLERPSANSHEPRSLLP